jgi:hypothetical protein
MSVKRFLPAALLAALGCFTKEAEPVALMTSSIPPIDAAVPAKIETVTFAVG